MQKFPRFIHHAYPLFAVPLLAILIIGNFAGRQCLCIICHQVIMLTMLFAVVLFLFHRSLFRGLFLIRQNCLWKIEKYFWAFPSLHSGQALGYNLPAKGERIFTSIPHAEESLHTSAESGTYTPTILINSVY